MDEEEGESKTYENEMKIENVPEHDAFNCTRRM